MNTEPLTENEQRLLRARIAEGDTDPFFELGGAEQAAYRLLATVERITDADGEWSRRDPVTWVWFTLGRLAGVVTGEPWAKAMGIAGGIVKQAILTASQVAYLDRDK